MSECLKLLCNMYNVYADSSSITTPTRDVCVEHLQENCKKNPFDIKVSLVPCIFFNMERISQDANTKKDLRHLRVLQGCTAISFREQIAVLPPF